MRKKDEYQQEKERDTKEKDHIPIQKQAFHNEAINIISTKNKENYHISPSSSSSSHILNKMLYIEKVLSSDGIVNKCSSKESYENTFTNITFTKFEIDDIEGIISKQCISENINSKEEAVKLKPNRKRVKCIKKVIFVLLIIVFCVFLHIILRNLMFDY